MKIMLKFSKFKKNTSTIFISTTWLQSDSFIVLKIIVEFICTNYVAKE